MEKKEYFDQLDKDLSSYAYKDRLLEELNDHAEDGGDDFTISQLGTTKDMNKTIKDLYEGTSMWVFVAFFIAMLAVPFLGLPFVESLSTQVGQGAYTINILPIVFVDLAISLVLLPVLMGSYLRNQRGFSNGYIGKAVFVAVASARTIVFILIFFTLGMNNDYSEPLFDLLGGGVISICINSAVAAFFSYQGTKLRIPFLIR